MKESHANTRQLIFDLEVDEEWANAIFDRKKRVEVRKNNRAKWGRMKLGSILRVIAKETKLSGVFLITDVRIYKGLEECIMAEGVRHLLPGRIHFAEALTIYTSFDGPDPAARQKVLEEYREHGAIAMQLTHLSPEGLGSILDDFDGGLLDGYLKAEKLVSYRTIPNALCLFRMGEGDPNCQHRLGENENDETAYLPVRHENYEQCMLCGHRRPVQISLKTPKDPEECMYLCPGEERCSNRWNGIFFQGLKFCDQHYSRYASIPAKVIGKKVYTAMKPKVALDEEVRDRELLKEYSRITKISAVSASKPSIETAAGWKGGECGHDWIVVDNVTGEVHCNRCAKVDFLVVCQHDWIQLQSLEGNVQIACKICQRDIYHKDI